MTKKKCGFSAMKPERQREIASMGGRAAHASGNAHEWNSTTARLAGSKSGSALAKRPGYMAMIGRAGGKRRAEVLRARREEAASSAENRAD